MNQESYLSQHPLVFGKPPKRFFVKEHHTTKLHFDFGLEMGGVLKNWASYDGPSLDPNRICQARQLADHRARRAFIEEMIPEERYGGGTVRTWDCGLYVPDLPDPLPAWASGRLHFTLYGERLRGRWCLLRTGTGAHPEWTLRKLRDGHALSGHQAEILGAGSLDAQAPQETKRRLPRRCRRVRTSQTESFADLLEL